MQETGGNAKATGPGGARVEVLEERTLSDGWNRLSTLRLVLHRRDGTAQEQAREIYRNGVGAAVLPYDPARRTVLLIRQFRAAALVNGDPAWLIESCAGLVEDGHTPAETAALEAEQETGYALDEVEQAFTLYASPGATAEKLHLFLARYDPAARRGRGGGLAEEGEEIEVLELPLAEALAMLGRGEIMDAKTTVLLLHLARREGL